MNQHPDAPCDGGEPDDYCPGDRVQRLGNDGQWYDVPPPGAVRFCVRGTDHDVAEQVAEVESMAKRLNCVVEWKGDVVFVIPPEGKRLTFDANGAFTVSNVRPPSSPIAAMIHEMAQAREAVWWATRRRREALACVSSRHTARAVICARRSVQHAARGGLGVRSSQGGRRTRNANTRGGDSGDGSPGPSGGPGDGPGSTSPSAFPQHGVERHHATGKVAA